PIGQVVDRDRAALGDGGDRVRRRGGRGGGGRRRDRGGGGRRCRDLLRLRVGPAGDDDDDDRDRGRDPDADPVPATAGAALGARTGCRRLRHGRSDYRTEHRPRNASVDGGLVLFGGQEHQAEVQEKVDDLGPGNEVAGGEVTQRLVDAE